jgi:eukaryotic-like serine/threonine-protein kinase
MIGSRLGPWTLDRELGRGGMGTVFLAHADTPAGPRPAAVKVLAPELAAEPGFLHRFQREIEILRKLDHPNIVAFLESGVEGGHYYFVMEYVPGPSYEALLLERGRLPWPEVLDLAWQVAPALKHAHDRGVIHRDLKPSNLLRAPAEQGPGPTHPAPVKLTDFGIASLFASPHLTVTGGVIGTPEYLSPEQAAGKPVTRRSDLYSLGVLLYTLLTGRTPFEGDPVDLLHKHRYGQFERPSRLVPEVHHELEEVVCQLLEKEPDRRPADAGVLFRRLDSLKKKLAFQASAATAAPEHRTAPASTGPSAREGPATLMSRLMRTELERQQRGGPLRRLFNHPLVLVPLFLLTVGALVWSLWPMSPETMFQRGSALMASSDPDDWDRAWSKYLDPLEQKYPDHPHKEEVAKLRQEYDERRAERRAERAAKWARPMGEGEWFFHRGLRLRRHGDEKGARAVWGALVEAYRDVPAERPWVRRAEEELAKSAREKRDEDGGYGSLREAVRKARALRKEGKKEEAQATLDALRKLYKGDPAAEAILKE